VKEENREESVAWIGHELFHTWETSVNCFLNSNYFLSSQAGSYSGAALVVYGLNPATFFVFFKILCVSAGTPWNIQSPPHYTSLLITYSWLSLTLRTAIFWSIEQW
jgi:hypothetical protein